MLQMIVYNMCLVAWKGMYFQIFNRYLTYVKK